VRFSVAESTTPDEVVDALGETVAAALGRRHPTNPAGSGEGYRRGTETCF
jgi:hypothetical protein